MKTYLVCVLAIRVQLVEAEDEVEALAATREHMDLGDLQFDKAGAMELTGAERIAALREQMPVLGRNGGWT